MQSVLSYCHSAVCHPTACHGALIRLVRGAYKRALGSISVPVRIHSYTMSEESQYNETVDYYSILMDTNPASRYTVAAIAILLISIIIPSLYSIIWWQCY